MEMTDNLKIFDNVEAYVAQGRVSAALDTLEAAVVAYPELRTHRARIEELRSGYGYMSDYALQGLPDPGLHERYQELIEAVRSLALSMRHFLRIKDAPTLYYNTLRYEKASPSDTIASLIEEYAQVVRRLSLASLTEDPAQASRELTRKAEALERRLFNRVWVESPLSASDDTALRDAFADESLPDYFKSLMVSAVFMGLMELYDERRMLLLMDWYDRGRDDISVRALCALLVGLWMYSDRYMSRRVRDRLEALKELPGWRADVRMATMQFVRSRDTERITRKFNDEVMPEMMKLRPEIEKLRDKPIDPEAIEENPEWAEMLDKSGVSDRLKELQELQEDGGDVMMATFGRLKTFPFFNDIANWFLPFHSGYSAIATDLAPEMAALIDMIGASPMFCDNDKYSVALSLGQIPPAQRDMMLGQLRDQGDKVDALRMAGMNSAVPGREALAANYVRSLYRFFKLFRRKGEFADPFALRLNIPAVPLLASEFDDEDTLMVIAEFYFKRGYYADALDVFERLSEKVAPTAALHQKMGYCHQSAGNIADALRHYEQADMLESGNRWTIKRLALCYRKTGQWEKALECYRRLAEFQPDDVQLALNTGLALVKMRRYDEALNFLFKAEFYGEGNEKATRALAWCTLLCGDYDRCVRYTVSMLASASPRPVDYLNAGHLSLLTGHPGEAVDHYIEALHGMDNDQSRFLKTLDSDRDTIAAFRDVDPHLFDIVVDTALTRASKR